nr:unnamed protein product [Digitaria exilis]
MVAVPRSTLFFRRFPGGAGLDALFVFFGGSVVVVTGDWPVAAPRPPIYSPRLVRPPWHITEHRQDMPEKDVFLGHIGGNVQTGAGKQDMRKQKLNNHGQPPPADQQYAASEYSSSYGGRHPYAPPAYPPCPPRKPPPVYGYPQPQLGWGFPPSDYPPPPEEPYHGYPPPPQPGYGGSYYGGGGYAPHQGMFIDQLCCAFIPWRHHGGHMGWIAAGAAAAGAGAYGAIHHFHHKHHHHGGGEYGGGYSHGYGHHGKFKHEHHGKFRHYARHDGKFNSKHAGEGKFDANAAGGDLTSSSSSKLLSLMVA